MDSLWRALILDTQLYANLQQALGLTLHRLPNDDLQRQHQSREIIYRRTLEWIYSLFGSRPLIIDNLRSRSKRLEGTYKIFVHTLHVTGKRLVFDVLPTLRVSELKEMFFHQEHSPMEIQRFIYLGEQLEDHHTLSYYKICNESKLHMVLHLKGCWYLFK